MNHSAPGSVALAIWMYRWLLCFYPRPFRQRFGHEMIQVFRVTCRASWQQGGGSEVLVLVLATAPDVIATAAKEHLTVGRTAWENMMATSLWARLGDIAAVVAIVVAVSLTVVGPLGAPGRYDAGLSWDHVIVGVQLLSRFMILVVIAAALRTQRTRMGRLFGAIALAGAGLRLLLVDVWLNVPLLNSHPQLLSVFFSTGGLLTALGLLGVIGLGVTTIRYRELEGRSYGPLRWQWWPFLGGSAGVLAAFFARPHTDIGTFLLTVTVFTVLPTWAYFAGTALGMLRASVHAHAPQPTNAG